MALYRLNRGLVVKIGERRYSFQRELDKATVQLEDIETGAYKTLKKSDLVRKISDGIFTVLSAMGDSTLGDTSGSTSPADVIVGSLKQHQILAWDRRRRYVVALRKRGVNKAARNLIERYIPVIASEIGDTKPPSSSTVIRWLCAYEINNRNVNALLPRHVVRSRRKSISDSTESLAWEFLKKHYFIRNGRSMKETYERYKQKADSSIETQTNNSKKIELLSLSTMERLAKQLSGYEKDRARLGPAAASAKWRHSVGGINATRPLERVEMDHTILDLYVIDDRSGIPLGRPTITILIDAYSSYILALYVSFEGETLGRLSRSIQLALRPKDDLTSLVPTKNEWITPGLWETLVVDNGLAFQSQQLRNIALQLGCDLEYCPTRKPWFKPHVERAILEMTRILPVRGKPEKTSGIVDKIDPVKNACVMFSDLCTCLTKWAVDVHPFVIPKRSLHRPIDRLMEGLENMPAPEFVTNIKSLDIITGLSKEITVRQDGVSMNYLNYQSPDLARMAKEQHSPTFRTIIKFDPNDLQRVWVQNPLDKKIWLDVPCKFDDYAKGLTLTQHKFIRAHAKGVLKKKDAYEQLSTARKELQEMFESATGRGRGLIKNMKRFAQIQGLSSLTGVQKDKDHAPIHAEQIVTPHDLELEMDKGEIPTFKAIPSGQFNGWGD